MSFNESQIERYARHIILQEVGGHGQAKLLDSKVLVVGAGGLGSPLVMYLAAAGVGVIAVVDDDVVDLSNLQRQVLHRTSRIGQPKVESARRAVAEINPEVRLIPHRERLGAANVMALIGKYDLVADGSDNFETRFLLNDACHFGGRTLVSAAILRFEGQISTFKSHLGHDHPCYRCLYREPPPPAEGLARLRAFMEEDTGDDFVMVNVIDMYDTPLQIDGDEPGDTSEQVLGKYMAYMYPALFSRASHPVFAGQAANTAMDLMNADGMESWTQGAGMRYRSRRDLFEIAELEPRVDGKRDGLAHGGDLELVRAREFGISRDLEQVAPAAVAHARAPGPFFHPIGVHDIHGRKCGLSV